MPEPAASPTDDERTVTVVGEGLASGGLGVHSDWEVGPQGKQRAADYRAAALLTARLDAPARAGQVATAAVTAGGEAARVHGLVLVVGDQAGVLAAAREAAWRDARGRAEQYAALAGVALGRVVRIEEVADARYPRAVPLGGGPAVEVGEAEVPARVAVTWALVDAPQPGAGGRL